MGFDDGLEGVDLHLRLHEAHGALELLFARDVADLLVVREPVAHLGVEVLLRPLADRRHARTDGVQRTHELTLVVGEAGLDEDDVLRHGRAR